MYLTDMGLINSTNGLEGKFVVFEDHAAISAHSLVTVLSHLAVVHNRDSVVTPGLDHPVHQLPLTEGVELQDVIRVGTVRESTA